MRVTLLTMGSWFVLATHLAAGALGAADRPMAVSPGASEEVSVIDARCPTFSWSSVPDAEGVELVIYEVDRLTREASETALWRKSLPKGASAWTPDRRSCLEPGGLYGWAVRSHRGAASLEWSTLLLFEVGADPSSEELRAALATIERYVAAAGNVSSPGRESSLQEIELGDGFALPVESAAGTTEVAALLEGSVSQRAGDLGLMKAAVHLSCGNSSPSIIRAVNNVNDAEITVSPGGPEGHCTINFGFDVTTSFWAPSNWAGSNRVAGCFQVSTQELLCARRNPATGDGVNGQIVVVLY